MTLLFYELKLQLKEIKTRSAFWLRVIVQLCCLWAEYYFYVLILYNFSQLYDQQSITQNSIVRNSKFYANQLCLILFNKISFDEFSKDTSVFITLHFYCTCLSVSMASMSVLNINSINKKDSEKITTKSSETKWPS